MYVPVNLNNMNLVSNRENPHLGGYISGGDIRTFCPTLWDVIIKKYKVKSIIDIGCGEGHSTRYFYDAGIEVLGVEGDINAIKNSPIRKFIVQHDYSLSPFIPPKVFDVCWCIDFVEHVEERFVTNFLITFTQCKIVFMTHAIPEQSRYNCVNEKDSKYWIETMSSIGFDYDEKESFMFRSKTDALYIKNSLLVFMKKDLKTLGVFTLLSGENSSLGEKDEIIGNQNQ